MQNGSAKKNGEFFFKSWKMLKIQLGRSSSTFVQDVITYNLANVEIAWWYEMMKI